MFYPLGKKLKKNLEGGGIHPPLYVQGLNSVDKIEGKISNDFGKQ